MHKDNQTSQAKVKAVVRVAIILSVATLAEFVIAFTMEPGAIKNFIFIALTLLKAYYIAGAFMHLAHEVKLLIVSVLFPLILVALLIFILIYESAHVTDVFYR